jgi:hypothetical protein
MKLGDWLYDHDPNSIYACGNCAGLGHIIEPDHGCNGDLEVCRELCPVGRKERCKQCLGGMRLTIWGIAPHVEETITSGRDDLVLTFLEWPDQFNRAKLLRAVRQKLKQIFGDEYNYKIFKACSFEPSYACPDPVNEFTSIQCNSEGWAYSRLNEENTDYYQAPVSKIYRITYIDTRGNPFP